VPQAFAFPRARAQRGHLGGRPFWHPNAGPRNTSPRHPNPPPPLLGLTCGIGVGAWGSPGEGVGVAANQEGGGTHTSLAAYGAWGRDGDGLVQPALDAKVWSPTSSRPCPVPVTGSRAGASWWPSSRCAGGLPLPQSRREPSAVLSTEPVPVGAGLVELLASVGQPGLSAARRSPRARSAGVGACVGPRPGRRRVRWRRCAVVAAHERLGVRFEELLGFGEHARSAPIRGVGRPSCSTKLIS
jgi:hypothetical protein